MKSLDKNKTKELEWDRFVKENHTNFSKDANGIKYEFYEDDLLQFITQQRTELLDEIDKSCKETPEIIKKWKCSEKDGWYIKNVIDSFKSQLINLLNKKDE